MQKKNHIERTDQPTLLGIEFFTGPSERIFSRQKRAVDQLIIVTGGVYLATLDTARGGQRLRAEAGDVVFWPTGSEDTDESEPGRPLRAFSLEFHWHDRPPDLPVRVRDTEHVIDRLAHRLLDRAHDPTRQGVLDWVAHTYLAAILAEYVALAEAAADPLLTQTTRYIEEHMRKSIRRADLARHVGMDPHHFGRKYRQITGRTPMEDVRRRKAAYAKQVLILSPTFSLTHIAKLVGVRDASALSRLLSRYAGTSARDIKKAARKR